MNKNLIKFIKSNFGPYGYTILISLILGIFMRLLGLSYNFTATVLTIVLILFNGWFFFVLPEIKAKNRNSDELFKFHTANTDELKGCVIATSGGTNSWKMSGQRLVTLRGSLSAIDGYYSGYNVTGSVNQINGVSISAGAKSSQDLTNRVPQSYATAN